MRDDEETVNDEAPKFQRVGSPEPEQSQERPHYQKGESPIDYAERLEEYDRQKKMGSPEEVPVNIRFMRMPSATRARG